MKRIISILLCTVLLVSALPVYAVETNKPLKITVATDTHFQHPSVIGDIEPDTNDPYTRGMLNREMFYYATQQGQMSYESYAIMKQLLKKFENSDDEYLLIGGDLANGNRASHVELAKLFKETEERSGKKIFVTTGNHDCIKERTDTRIDINEFKEIYADFGFNEAICVHETSASYTYDLSSEYRLIAIDSCVYGEDEGKINDSIYNWIKDQVDAAKKDGKKLIAMMHHSILPHFELQVVMSNKHNIAQDFADWGIKFVFTGHIHANDITMATSKSGNNVYDIQTGSLITSPNAFRHVEFSRDKVEIKSDHITEIDINDLPGGYSEKQLQAIENDFSEYAYSFFEAGMCRYINRYIGSAGKLGRFLKLKEDGKAYAALNSLMLNIGDALLLPIYDDGSTPDVADSIEELAKQVGKTIPDSEYIRVYQVVAAVMQGFYKGDEPADTKDKEVALLLECIKPALASCISNMIYSGNISGGIDKLLTEATGISPRVILRKHLTVLNYSLMASDSLITAYIKPLLYGLSCDYNAPDDVNVTLESFDAPAPAVSAAPINILQRIIRYFKNVYLIILN